jgi:NADH:ubiquinone oxidoreductase subunit H
MKYYYLDNNLLLFFIRILAEMNRRSIDLIVGEFGLFPGFNVEYFRIQFAFHFIEVWDNYFLFGTLFYLRL